MTIETTAFAWKVKDVDGTAGAVRRVNGEYAVEDFYGPHRFDTLEACGRYLTGHDECVYVPCMAAVHHDQEFVGLVVMPLMGNRYSAYVFRPGSTISEDHSTIDDAAQWIITQGWVAHCT